MPVIVNISQFSSVFLTREKNAILKVCEIKYTAEMHLLLKAWLRGSKYQSVSTGMRNCVRKNKHTEM